MMDIKYEALKVLKQLFSKQSFADVKLVDGTIVSAEAFEPGQDIFILDENGERIPAPNGEHEIEDGSKVIVSDGKIESIIKAEDSEAEVEIEEEMAIEVEIEPMIDEVPDKEKEIAILKGMIEEMMEKMKVMEDEMGKMKMSSDEVNKTIADSIIELSDNFSKIPASEKIDINPVDYQSRFEKVTKSEKRKEILDWISKNK
jgi:hypothetical protein